VTSLALGWEQETRVPQDVRQRVRSVLREHAQLGIDMATLADDYDLYRAGMDSRASVNVMLGLEQEFGVEFPDTMLRRGVFGSVTAIANAVLGLMAPAEA
jgi:acyl carrier protein